MSRAPAGSGAAVVCGCRGVLSWGWSARRGGLWLVLRAPGGPWVRAGVVAFCAGAGRPGGVGRAADVGGAWRA